MRTIDHWIAGRTTSGSSDRTAPVFNPATGEEQAEVRLADKEDVEAAIAAGRARTLRLGDLDAVRDWTHARDVVRGMHLALGHSEPGDYVLAGGVGRTVRDFATAALAAAGLPAEGRIEVDPSLVRGVERTPLVGDATRARTVLGWRPETTFEELVSEMVEADLRACG